MSLRVCCIDDTPTCIHGLRQAMVSAGHSLIGSLNRFERLDAFLSENPCDIIVSELRVAHTDLVDACLNVLEKHHVTKLIVYSYDENPTHLARASAMDVWDYIPKRYSVQRLIQSCESTITGQRPLDSLIVLAKQFLMHPHKPSESIHCPLTRREYQILIHLSLGLSNRDISKSLNISLETVKEHVQNVLRKLRIHDRTAAAIWSLKNGVPTLRFDPLI
jgi:DNA-binding NarL/FixJ family response regulator